MINSIPVIPGGARPAPKEGDPALPYPHLDSLPLAKLPLRSAGNDKFQQASQ